MKKQIIAGLLVSFALSAPVSTYAITHAEWLAQLDTPVQTASTTVETVKPVEIVPQSAQVQSTVSNEAQIKQLQAIIVLLTQILRELQIKKGIIAV